MSSKYVLPFSIDVEMRMYQDKAFPLGIIKANLNDYDIWLCGKLINCVYKYSGVFDVIDDDLWSINDGLAFVQNIYVAPESLAFSGFDLIEFNKSMLRTGHYITGTYNEYYIPGKHAYLNYDFNHDYVIFGYDDSTKVFKSATYLPNSMYGYVDITYDDYLQAVTMNKISRANVDYFQINSSYVPNIEVTALVSKLKDYLYCKKNGQTVDDRVFGVNVWSELAKYVLSVKENIDLRYGRMYMEYHGLMLKRIQVLKKLGYIDNAILEQKYQELYHCASQVHHSFIKYNLTHKSDLLERISSLINNTTNEEKKLIEVLIKDLAGREDI